mmetsp:Transcript_6621/g.5721  ORF Transcript_6621/g.5721 Transcript_6621/m.5721 type:complete len:98 (+) Transcript_6621:89-382(+)
MISIPKNIYNTFNSKYKPKKSYKQFEKKRPENRARVSVKQKERPESGIYSHHTNRSKIIKKNKLNNIMGKVYNPPTKGNILQLSISKEDRRSSSSNS